MNGRRRTGHLLAIAGTFLLLTGCAFLGYDSCKFRPISGSLPLAAIGLPRPGGSSGLAVGACSGWVRYNGLQYTDVRFSRSWYDVWTLTEQDLQPVGHATEATEIAGPFRDDTVYSIPGVDPADAIAMVRANGTISVLLGSSVSEPPAALCPFFRSPAPAFTCE